MEGITLEDVCRYMGIKRTNANRTKSKYREDDSRLLVRIRIRRISDGDRLL